MRINKYKIIKKTIFLFIITAIVFTVFALTTVFADVDAAGTCGSGLRWELEYETGILTISGKGDMTKYAVDDIPPWNRYKSSIKEIVFNDGITSIGAYAFYSLDKIEKVTLADSLTKIYEGAFKDCTSLKEITITENVQDIQTLAFSGCTLLEKVNLYAMNTSFGYSVFKGCNSIKSVNTSSLDVWCSADFADIEANPISISHKFSVNDELVSSIEISSNVRSVSDFAFYSCNTLKNVKVAANSQMTKIGTCAFYKCDSLEKFEFEGTTLLSDIGPYAFYYCSKLENFEIPALVSEIQPYTFFNCETIKKIELHDGIKKVDEKAFSCCFDLEELYISDSLVEIGEKAFYGDINLHNVFLPKSVDIIRDHAFSSCGKAYGENNIYIGSEKIPNSWDKTWNEDFSAAVNVGHICEYEGEISCSQRQNCTICKRPSFVKHNFKEYSAHSPSCTENGWFTYKKCENEGCTFTTCVEILPSGHSLELVHTIESGCKTKGQNQYVCKICSAQVIEQIPAAHKFGNNGICTVCGEREFPITEEPEITTPFVTVEETTEPQKTEIEENEEENNNYTVIFILGGLLALIVITIVIILIINGIKSKKEKADGTDEDNPDTDNAGVDQEETKDSIDEPSEEVEELFEEIIEEEKGE